MLDFLMLTEDEKRGLKTPLCRTPVSDLLQFAAQFLPTTFYPSTLSEASLFGINSVLTLTTSSANTSHDGSADTVGSSNCSADNKSSAGNKPEDEVVDNPAARASRFSSVDHQPRLSSSTCDAVNRNYPPMPATAQHVSEVQDRILRGSSVNEDLCSPIQADTVDAERASQTAVDPGMIVTGLTETTPDVFPDVCDLEECLSDISCHQTEKLVETPRSVTQRRSRIVARFGLVQHSEYMPDCS